MIIIVTQPQSGTYQVGDYLTVVATGNNLHYQWQKLDGVWTNIEGETTSSLRVVWSGTYRVVLEEKAGGLITGGDGNLATWNEDVLVTQGNDNLYVENCTAIITDLGNQIIAFESAGEIVNSDSAIVVATSVFDDLIFDRVLADVDRVKTLRSRITAGVASQEEKTEWGTNLKGSYNISDLNRIERALLLIQTYSSWYGKTITYPTTPSERWTANTYPTSTELNKTLANVNVVKTVWEFTDSLPSDFDSFDYVKANQIEKLLHKVREVTE